jgi:hypothetical protein
VTSEGEGDISEEEEEEDGDEQYVLEMLEGESLGWMSVVLRKNSFDIAHVKRCSSIYLLCFF